MWGPDRISCPWDNVEHTSVPRGVVYRCPGSCNFWIEWAPRSDAGWVVSTSVPPPPELAVYPTLIAPDAPHVPRAAGAGFALRPLCAVEGCPREGLEAHPARCERHPPPVFAADQIAKWARWGRDLCALTLDGQSFAPPTCLRVDQVVGLEDIPDREVTDPTELLWAFGLEKHEAVGLAKFGKKSTRRR